MVLFNSLHLLSSALCEERSDEGDEGFNLHEPASDLKERSNEGTGLNAPSSGVLVFTSRRQTFPDSFNS